MIIMVCASLKKSINVVFYFFINHLNFLLSWHDKNLLSFCFNVMIIKIYDYLWKFKINTLKF